MKIKTPYLLVALFAFPSTFVSGATEELGLRGASAFAVERECVYPCVSDDPLRWVNPMGSSNQHAFYFTISDGVLLAVSGNVSVYLAANGELVYGQTGEFNQYAYISDGEGGGDIYRLQATVDNFNYNPNTKKSSFIINYRLYVNDNAHPIHQAHDFFIDGFDE